MISVPCNRLGGQWCGCTIHIGFVDSIHTWVVVCVHQWCGVLYSYEDGDRYQQSEGRECTIMMWMFSGYGGLWSSILAPVLWDRQMNKVRVQGCSAFMLLLFWIWWGCVGRGGMWEPVGGTGRWDFWGQGALGGRIPSVLCICCDVRFTLGGLVVGCWPGWCVQRSECIGPWDGCPKMSSDSGGAPGEGFICGLIGRDIHWGS